MVLQEEETQQILNPPLIIDELYCEEEADLGECSFVDNGSENLGKTLKKGTFLPFSFIDHDLFWEDDELLSLMSKEKETHHGYIDVEPLFLARKGALEWIFNVKEHYGFNALTMVLAVNYFDRFISTLKFQKDKPWMGQLAAVACLSLAAKVEETQVPLLLHLQVGESKYAFDSNTIQRMELLVLSTLQWRMNPVTPISFFNHITSRLGLNTHLHLEFLVSCERLLLFLIADSRFMLYTPSILAAATMLHVIKEIEPCHYHECQKQLIGVLKTCEDQVNACHKLILELLGSNFHCKGNQGRKRKHPSILTSPNGVIDASFSCDSWVDSWSVTSFVSPFPHPQFKRSRARNSMFVDVLSSPR